MICALRCYHFEYSGEPESTGSACEQTLKQEAVKAAIRDAPNFQLLSFGNHCRSHITSTTLAAFDLVNTMTCGRHVFCAPLSTLHSPDPALSSLQSRLSSLACCLRQVGRDFFLSHHAFQSSELCAPSVCGHSLG